jgi:hypothetical protein
MKTTAIVLAVALGLGVAGSASASTGVKIGSLTCKVAPGTSYVIGSNRDMKCTFYGVNGKREQYTGSLDKLGLDLGVTDKAVMGWVVFAVGQHGRGALAGNYIGAAADASLGIGGGAKVLVGGFDHSLTLQPVRLQAQTGLNVALGVASLRLAVAQ